MRFAFVALAAVTFIAGCVPATGSANPATPRATGASTAALIARPLKLPLVPPGTACPVTPVANVSAPVRDPRGRGPFYLGGPQPTGAFPWNKTVYAVTGSALAGPMLFRGARIDAVGRLQFSGDRAIPSDVGTLLTSDGGGVSDIFYDRVLHGSNGGAFYLYPSTKGCYAIQVDAPTFEDVIIVSAG